MKNQKIISLFFTMLVCCISFQAVGQSITINGPDPVCVGSTHKYDIAPDPGSTYQWFVNNKGFIKTYNSNDVDVTWGMHGTGEVRYMNMTGTETW